MKYKFCIIFAVILFASCKTTRTIIKTEPKPVNQTFQLIEQVQKNQPQFKTANVSKMSLGLEMNERKMNVSASCKIRKDSAIYISIQPFLGIEMFKAELTTDSMRVFDKMNHKYYVVDYDFFNKRFGVNVDFNSLQSLLTAQLFCVGKKEIQVDSCRLTALTAGQNKIDFVNNNMLQTTQTSAIYVIQQVILGAKNSDYQLQTDYADYAILNGVNFPQKITLQAKSLKTRVLCEFSILKVGFNTDLKFTPTSSDRYTKGNIEQLLKK